MEPDGLFMSSSSQIEIQLCNCGKKRTSFELFKREETVDHGSIVTVGGRGQDDEEHEEVETPQVLPLVPCDVGELLPGNPEEAGGPRGIEGRYSAHCGC
jgi:hypothetical protein